MLFSLVTRCVELEQYLYNQHDYFQVEFECNGNNLSLWMVGKALVSPIAVNHKNNSKENSFCLNQLHCFKTARLVGARIRDVELLYRRPAGAAVTYSST